MHLEVEEDRGVKVMLVDDLSDDMALSLFKERLSPVLGRCPVFLILDLKEANFINSLGIGTLVSLLRRINEGGGRLVLESPRDNVRQLFRVLGLDRIFLITKTRDESYASMGCPGSICE